MEVDKEPRKGRGKGESKRNVGAQSAPSYHCVRAGRWAGVRRRACACVRACPRRGEGRGVREAFLVRTRASRSETRACRRVHETAQSRSRRPGRLWAHDRVRKYRKVRDHFPVTTA
eukprot:6172419-Pleurochrysis_carterae.AAC.1